MVCYGLKEIVNIWNKYDKSIINKWYIFFNGIFFYF